MRIGEVTPAVGTAVMLLLMLLKLLMLMLEPLMTHPGVQTAEAAVKLKLHLVLKRDVVLAVRRVAMEIAATTSAVAIVMS